MELKKKKTDRTPWNTRPVERTYWKDKQELRDCFRNVVRCGVSGQPKYCRG